MAVEREEQFYETQRAQLLRWLPWLHVFRAARIALDPRKIVLGALAAFVLMAGDGLIDALPFAPSPTQALHARLNVAQPWDQLLPADANWMDSTWLRGVSPLESIIEPGSRLFAVGNSWADVAFAWTQLLFHLAVWSLLGGAIARIAAVQFAKRESITAPSAVQYSTSRFMSYCGAPLLPLVFIGLLWLICLVFGLIGRIPGIGTSIAGALWVIPLLLGVALAVILLVIAASWPLMFATISAEGTDAFDALSRGYDYILNRTWYALWLLLLTVVSGAIVITFVSLVCQAGVHLAYLSTAWGMGASNLEELTPLQFPADPMLIAANSPDSFGGAAATFWLKVLSWFVRGFVISYFWTAVTIIYFLLRLSLDAKPLDQVYLPVMEAADPLPLVGIPAAERRAAERTEPTSTEPKPPDSPAG